MGEPVPVPLAAAQVPLSLLKADEGNGARGGKYYSAFILFWTILLRKGCLPV